MKFIILFILSLMLIPLALAITGTGGTITVDGHTDIAAFNGTNSFSIRGLSDYISGQFKFPSATEILLRGRFSQLKAENTAPAAPSLESPVNNTFSNTTSTTFSWTNTTDADNDTLSYRIEIYNNSALTQEFHINNSIPEIPTPTSTIVDLTADQEYYWQALANDSGKNSSFSELRLITMDTTLPTAFNLTSPADGTSSTDNTPTLEWDAPTETNFENYTIEVSTDANFSTINTTENSSTNSFSNWANAFAAGIYYWRVTAVDKANNQQQSENNLSFTITAVSETIERGGGTVSVAGGSSPKPYSFKIIAPPSITVFQDESITVPLTIQNIGNSINLNNIQLSVQADSPGVIATLDRTFISTLRPESNTIVNLMMSATELSQDSFGVTVTADVSTPKLQDSVKIITSVAGREDLGKKSSQQLVFTKKFFDGNPECKELLTEIEKAEQLIAKESHEEAIKTLESAVNKCRDLISVKAVKKQGLIDLTFNVIKENKTASIISSQVLVFLIILGIIFKKFIRRKEKKIELDF